jgi:hypothetical protein
MRGGSSLEIGVDDVDELIRSLYARLTRTSPDQVFPHVILKNLCEETIHGTARGGKKMHDVRAVRLSFERALHGFHLTSDATDTVEQLLLVANGMSHGTLLADRRAVFQFDIPMGGTVS